LSAPSVRRRELERFGRYVLDEVGKGGEVCRTARNVEVPRDRGGFTRIRHFGCEKVVKAAGDLGGELYEQRDAFGRGQRAPPPT